jgi:hypothetical protein
MSLPLDVLILNAGIVEPFILESSAWRTGGNLEWQQVRTTLARSSTP